MSVKEIKRLQPEVLPPVCQLILEDRSGNVFTLSGTNYGDMNGGKKAYKEYSASEPMYLKIKDEDNDGTYELFGLSVEDAKEMIQSLQSMVDYFEG